MLLITVHEKTYRLASEVSMTDAKEAVLDAMRAAPAFLSLRTDMGDPVEVSIAATTGVVLEKHDEPLPTILHAGDIEPENADLFDFDYF